MSKRVQIPRRHSGNESVSAGDTRDAGSIPELGRFLEEEASTCSSVLDWTIPWTEDSGPQSMGSPRVRHDWASHTGIEKGLEGWSTNDKIISHGWRFGDDFLLLYVFIYVFIIWKIFLFTNIYSGNIITWLLLGHYKQLWSLCTTDFQDVAHIDHSVKGAPWSCVVERPSSLPFSVQPCPVISTNIYLESTISNIVARMTEIAKSRQQSLPLPQLHSSEGGRQ